MQVLESLYNLLNEKPSLKIKARRILDFPIRYYSQRLVNRDTEYYKSQTPSTSDFEQQTRLAKSLKFKPKISVIVPTYNTPPNYFNDMVDSVVSQTYENWELVIVDDASPDESVRHEIRKVTALDERIVCKFLKSNHHISKATNEGIKIATGEYISLFDHDDLLRRDALFEVVSALNYNNKLEFIYTDEAKTDSENKFYTDLFFKPDFNFDMLRSINFITHFTTIKRSTLDRLGFLDSNFDGAQDWELFMRITRSIDLDKIHHIQKLLYVWRVHDSSTASTIDAKPYVITSQRRALEEDLVARRIDDARLFQDEQYPAQWITEYKPNSESKGTHIIVQIDSLEFDKSLLEGSADYYVLSRHHKDKLSELRIEALKGDAQRDEIGLVVGRLEDYRQVNTYIKSVLDSAVSDVVIKSPSRSLSKHFYQTVRYNIPEIIDFDVMVIKADKLINRLDPEADKIDINEISRSLTSDGLLNLYNPSIKVLK